MIAVVFSCQNSTENNSKATSENESITSSSRLKPLREKMLMTEEQQALTPDMVIQSLKEGNKR